jgi:hypothetical protein
MPEETARLTALTSITSVCLTKLGVGRSGPVDEIDPSQIPAWSHVNLTADDLEPVLEICTSQIEAAKELIS